MADLSGKRIAFLATDMVEQVELTEPWKAVEQAGGTPELISLEEGEIQGFNHYDKADTFKVDRTVDSVSAEEYDALVQPGGVGNPDTLRMDENAVRFVRDFVEAGKPVAVICHGPWMLVEADLVRGRTLTSFPSLKTDIRNAGGNWVDQEVVLEDRIITSGTRTIFRRSARRSSRNSRRPRSARSASSSRTARGAQREPGGGAAILVLARWR